MLKLLISVRQRGELQAILNRGLVAVIADNARFLGLGHPQRCIDRLA
ncbi:hypothetical protein LNQ03_21965 [Klebsiella pneumoniae subsp. pneumoniae]|nr:hypothetical protein [Klebsiella pneumoniae subsp. pneumoniae]